MLSRTMLLSLVLLSRRKMPVSLSLLSQFCTRYDYPLSTVAGQPFIPTFSFNISVTPLLELLRVMLPFVHIRPAPAPRRKPDR